MWVLACTALSTFFTVSLAHQPEVTTSLGTLKGLTLKTIFGRPFYAFQGVPYAKPPVGNHRFKQSIPSGPWTGIYNATRPSNMCIQEVTRLLLPNVPFDSLGSEDCLYLNVFTPKLRTGQVDDKLLDVIVYIHGGAFQAAAGNVWGPLILLDRDVILVTFNYRLGLMGFLSFEDAVVPGNNGLKDQTLALRWVRNHIAAFGGDPNKVTIAGMSAGGASVHYQMLSPLSKGLFQKAISNSGSALNPWSLAKAPRKSGLLVAETVGCPTNDTAVTLKCLRERSADHLIGVVHSISGSGEISSLQFLPVVEPVGPHSFITHEPEDLIKSNVGSDVPALFSYCDDEGSIFSLPALVDEKNLLAMENNWDELLPHKLRFAESKGAKEISRKIRERFLGDKKIKDNLHGYSKMFGERFFVDGIQKAAMLHAGHQSSPVYSYMFSFRTPKGFNTLEQVYAMLQYEGGSSHGNDNSFVFNAAYLKPIQDFPELLPMAKYMTDIWMTFIKQNPAGNWSTVKSALPKFTYLDIRSSDSSQNTFKSEDSVGQIFWDSLSLQPSHLKSSQS